MGGIAIAIAAVCLHPATAEAQTRTWLGTSNDVWSNGNNWSGLTAPSGTTTLVWSSNSTANRTSTNDISGLTTIGMNFTGAPGPVTIGGTSLAISATTTSVSIQTGSQAVTINMPLSMKFNTLTLNTSGGGPLTINGVIGESGTVAGISFAGVSGWGQLTLNGSNTFSGAVTARSGTITIGNLGLIGTPQALGTGTFVILGRNTAAEQGFVRYTGPATTTNLRVQLGNVNSALGGGGFLNDGTGAVIWTGSMVVNTAATTNTRSFTLGGSNVDDNQWQGSIVDRSPAAPVALTKADAGKWILSGTNTYSGTTTVAAGVLGIANNLALQNSPLDTSGAGTIAITVTNPTLGGLVGSKNLTSVITSGYGSVTNLTLNPGPGATYTYGGTVSDGAVGMTLTKTGSGTHVLTGANSYTGGTLINAGILQIGDGDTNGSIVGNVTLTSGSGAFLFNRSDAISFPGVIAGSGTVAKQGAGMLTLTGSNTFTRAPDINDGLVAFDWIANGGQTSPLGSGSSVNLGSGTFTGTLRYIGTGHSSNRGFDLAGTTGGGGIQSNGTGPLVLTGTVSASGVGSKEFTLGGSNTGTNSIGPINGTDVSVTKTGPGTWRLTGNSGYSGQLKVLDGTVVVADAVGSSGASPVGNNTTDLPIVGDSAATSGTAAFLAEGVTVSRGLSVPAASGSSGSQVVVLGGVGTGTTAFLNGASIKLGRSVTLQASTGGRVEFWGQWQDLASGTNPAVAFTVGSSGNAGTVAFNRDLPDLTVALNVANGTAQLMSNNDRIYPITPVTVGSGLGSATLDLNGFSQTLSNFTFAGNSGSVTSGTLRLASSGTVSLSPVVVSGTGHVITADVALDDPASFNVNAGGWLLVSGPIGTGSNGAKTLTKSGPGILELSAANTYSGATIISQGTLALGAAGSFADSPTITVGDAGSSGAVLDLTAKSAGFAFGAGQMLKGGGTVKQLSSGTLTVAGLFSPGNSPGLFTYDGGTTLLSGTTLMEIWGTSRATSPSHGSGFYDAVNVVNGGILNFNGGTLELTFSQFFDTDTSFSLFSVLDSASLAGNFSGVNVSGAFYTGLSWSTPSATLWKSSETAGGQSLEFNATTGTLVIVVPEPSTLVLLAIGGMGLVAGLQRRRSVRLSTASRSRAAGSCAARPARSASCR